MKLIFSALSIFIASSVFAATCPTAELAGQYNVTETIGCDYYDRVVGVRNALLSDGTLEYGLMFNNDLTPSLTFHIRNTMTSSQTQCHTVKDMSYWKWYPNPRKDVYWGILKDKDQVFVLRGDRCSYRLERIQ